MSSAQVQVISRDLGIPNCANVTLCMKDDWADKTVSGVPLLTGKVINISNYDIPATQHGCYQEQIITTPCPPCGNVYPSTPTTSSYKIKGKVYTINIDLDDQVLNDPNTTKPWMPVSGDVCELIPFTCLPSALTEAIKTNMGLQVDACTLQRDGNIIKLPDTVETDTGVKKILGFNDEGCAVRAAPVLVSAVLSDESDSLGDISANTQRLIDYDLVEIDTAEAVNTGAAWTFTAPVTGYYRVTASIRFSNETWGHHAGSDYAAVSIYTKKNEDDPEILGVEYVSGFDDSDPIQMAPVAEGTRLMSLAAGDTLQFFAEHTDDHLGSVHGMVKSASRVTIERVF